MDWISGPRALVVGLAAAGFLALQACAPITRVIDTPKEGDQIALNVEQGMQVRWSNLSPNEGTWSLETEPKAAVTLVGKTAQPGAGGGVALDLFDFVARQKGAERLTFVYKRHDGAPASAEERITVDVNVS
jgi:hypothetical protein